MAVKFVLFLLIIVNLTKYGQSDFSCAFANTMCDYRTVVPGWDIVKGNEGPMTNQNFLIYNATKHEASQASEIIADYTTPKKGVYCLYFKYSSEQPKKYRNHNSILVYFNKTSGLKHIVGINHNTNSHWETVVYRLHSRGPQKLTLHFVADKGKPPNYGYFAIDTVDFYKSDTSNCP